jgi:hypothetical protein
MCFGLKRIFLSTRLGTAVLEIWPHSPSVAFPRQNRAETADASGRLSAMCRLANPLLLPEQPWGASDISNGYEFDMFHRLKWRWRMIPAQWLSIDHDFATCA